ncbi:TPA: hypothetical protein HA241_03205 [Candidatus Woesearchaeota archaeon]|nr:hypothetical protein [Candidatus Woesearchaeota archaeon]
METMEVVRSSWWPWIFMSGVAVTFLFSFFLIYQNGTYFPYHFPLLDFLPLILWIFASFYVVWRYGTRFQHELQRIAQYAFLGAVGFWSAFLLSILSLRIRFFYFVAVIIFYALFFLSWSLLQHYAKERHIRVSWNDIWVGVFLLFLVSLAAGIVQILLGSIGSVIIFPAGLYLVYTLFVRKIDLPQSHLLLFMELNLFSFALWTFLFILFGILLFFF